ncbi:hypothetical protein MUO66_00875 [Candidatus Bathyarchaeota archaeon]|nr:hypothetical protein [Candidatus Bathyarchaeota archaeon]
MKMRILKLDPTLFVEMLRGTKKSNISNLPNNLELIDIKFDLFSDQIQVVVRSDDFEDVADSYPIPNFKISTSVSPPVISRSLVASKPDSKVTKKPDVNTNKVINAYQKEFNPDQLELLSFTIRGDYLIVKPVQYLKNEWNEINEVVKNIGGEWIKGSIISYWKIPI